MKSFNAKTKLLLVIVIFGNLSGLYAQSNKALEVLWQKEFGGSDHLSCSPGTVTCDENTNSLVIIGTSFRPKVYSEGNFWLWEIDQSGNMIKTVIIKKIPEELGANAKQASRLFAGMTISPNGHISAVGKLEGINPSFMGVDRNGKQLFAKSVHKEELKEYNNLILNKIKLHDGNVLLIGKDGNDDGLVIKVDSQGNRVWKKTYDIGQLEFFTDGIALDNNDNFLVIGRSVKPGEEMSISEPSFIWMLKCDGNGKTVSDKKFKGCLSPSSLPQVCKLDSGDFVAVYDKGTETTSTDLTIKGFSSNLEAIWEKSILKSEDRPPVSFKIQKISESGFVVAYNIDFSDLSVNEYDRHGDELSSIYMDNVVKMSNFHLVSANNKAFIILQTRPDGNEISKVKIVALKLNQSE